MLNATDFINLLAGLVECLPRHKALSERGLAVAWSAFPNAAKHQLTTEHLSYAASQRLLDPRPNEDLAIHIQLLSYLYPLRDGLPATDRPVRNDLAQRMKAPHTFHPIGPVRADQAPPPPTSPSLPPFWQLESLGQRRRRLERLAQQTQSSAQP